MLEMTQVGLAAAAAATTVIVVVMIGLLATGMYRTLLWRRLTKHKEKEDEEQSAEKVLRIYLAPEAEKVDMPSLKGYTAVPLRGFNLLPAYINHRYCELFVDCGTSSALMKYRRAEHLGLLCQATRVKLIHVRMWARQTLAKMLVVEAVSVELPGGVSFPCTFLVAPKHSPINLLRNDIFLDNATLRRTQAVQCFSPTSTTLFFPCPMPQWRPRTSPDSQFVLGHARLGRCVKNQRLMVHVDTGARHFYASNKHHRPEMPVEVVVAANNVIEWEALMPVPSTTFDFVLGTQPLARYGCVLDFAKEHLYLSIGSRVFRTSLRRTRTL